MTAAILYGLMALGITVALVFVLPPLFRTPREHHSERRALNIAVLRDQLKDLQTERDNGALTQEQFEQAKLELEDRLTEDALSETADTTGATVAVSHGGRWVAWVVAVLVPVLAGGIYIWRGTPDAAINPPSAQSTNDPHGGAMGMAKVEAELARIKEAAEANPTDGKAWFKLGLANMAMERFPAALEALKKASEIAPDDAAVWAHYGEAVALAGNRDMEGEPIRLVRKALSINPTQNKALELAGIYAYQHEAWAEAIKNWQLLLENMPPQMRQSEYGNSIAEAVNDARSKAGMPAAAPKNQSAAGGGSSISGRLELAAALKGKVSPDDTVFLFARVGESGPPLAVMRVKVGALPMDFVLDESMAMSPEMSLAGKTEVVVTARISKSGQNKPMPGDLEGRLANAKVGAKGVRLVIDHIRP